MKRLTSLVLALLLLTPWVCCGQSAPPLRSAVGFYLDTVISIKAYTDDADLLNKALEECGRYEKIFSKTIEGSQVWRINHALGEPTQVLPQVAQLLELSLEVSRLSGGAFDVTVAPATALWDFKNPEPVLPDKAALEQAAALTDYTQVKVEGDVVTLPKGMEIDLGGVAKGYIADQVGQFLKDNGVASALLDFGGNVVAIGHKIENGQPWRVGVQDPAGPRNAALLKVVNAQDLCVVTSGNYERYFELDGVRYHHLLDPDTGWPAQSGVSSVTIFAGSSAWADALSTAAFVLGEEKGRALIESIPGAEAMFVADDGEITMTSGASAYLAQ